MISRDIINFFSLTDPLHDMPYNFHMTFGPIPFAELPDINNIAIKYYDFGSDRLEIGQQVFGAASIGTEMNIGKYQHINFSLSLSSTSLVYQQ